MNIPNYSQQAVVDEDKYFTRSWQTVMDTLLQNLRSGIGAQGFQITTVSSDPNSVVPPTPGGLLGMVQATFGQQNGVIPGTLIFDPFQVNAGGGIGQLKVFLMDTATTGSFHNITNT